MSHASTRLHPLVDQIPGYIKATNGVLNSGDQLIRWLYYTYDFYVSDEDEEEDEEEEAMEGEEMEEEMEEDSEDEGEESDDQESDVGDDQDDSDQDDSEQEQEPVEANVGEVEFHLEEPSEEYARRVNAYNEWVRYKE
ncbi:hypothetical protein PG997_014317 [Apiospora hydei]|uniref:Uncharacterized protein n=1 Tax=Apiospora hydei TaxID=1337664 RepID=A0ABR1UTH8_9PEZI